MASPLAGDDTAQRLRVTEVFHSLQGESRSVGLPTVFVRLTGCPLRCVYCDTEYAFRDGEWRSVPEVVAEVASFDTRHVTVTGGEPLAQRGCISLLSSLCDAGHEVSLETSGALDVSKVDHRVIKVMDLKTPGSGEVARNLYRNLNHIRAHDQIKFVLTDRADYDWMRTVLIEHSLPEQCEVLVSPVHGKLAPAELAEWVLADRLKVRFQVQLHKYLWGDARGR
ncbi:MAG: 7-carboxy-7-deazaguanine synthase QueE [Gammaproteobacteria bacterium]|nr:7-carboxy-7-deazaguanine synthase QueE [Gammaproteobacteria bacterium]MCP5137924.1 7-carboxy-7-deazaguanine synthase QueE [Gammaproteobacteria bacterium]